jgi:CRP/FNR family cyclic AMP-dependent transcriptional regulator
MRDLVAQLGTVKHFANLTESARQAIVAAGQVRRFGAGSIIFAEDEPCAGMFVLLSGQVHLCKMGLPGQQNIMTVIEPIIMFNEVAVLDGGPNPVTAIAIQTCVTWHIGCAAFHKLMSHYPEVGLGLLPVLAARNRTLIGQYEDLSFRSVPARTAKLLLDLSLYGQQPIDRRNHSIYEMAARIATVPEAISRALKTFKSKGYILSTRVSITVRQPEALAHAAQIGPRLIQD